MIMNREELENEFEKEFSDIEKLLRKFSDQDLDDIKTYIFDTIIPEVLKSIIDKIDKDSEKSKMYWLTTNDIKQKAKEQFWIDL